MSDQMIDITGKIPMLLTYNEDEMVVKNVPMFDFKDSLLDYGRLFGYLRLLPEEEQNRKIKDWKRIFPELILD
jgi:hypothetical protein